MNYFIMSKFSALNHQYVQRTAVLQNIMFLRFLLHVMCMYYTGAVNIVQVQRTLCRCSVHCTGAVSIVQGICTLRRFLDMGNKNSSSV